MNRSRLAGLLVVLVALVGAAAYGSQGKATTATKDTSLVALQAAAALAPCPTGIGAAFPKLTLACLGGGAAVRLDGPASGVPTLVNIYGSWCVPCQREMPVLVAFSKQASGKVALLGVDTEDEPRLALLFAKDVGQTWPAVVDDDKVVLRRYASGPPVTLFVDAKGTVAHVQVGAFTGVAQIAALAKTYLGVSV